jgi:hypothetical protein
MINYLTKLNMFEKEEDGTINTKLVILYIVLVVLMTSLITWGILAKSNADLQNSPATGAVVAMNILPPDDAPVNQNGESASTTTDEKTAVIQDQKSDAKLDE